MKQILFFLSIVASVFVAACGPSGDPSGERKVRFYQSPMHPWITSEEPGRCTICGMALVPVYEGEAGFETGGERLVLSESNIQTLDIATVEAQPGKVVRELRLAGVFQDDESRHRIIAAFYDGRIEKPFIEQVGESVRRGQPLAEIYSPELLYVVREFQRALAGGDSGIAENAGRRLIQFGLTPGQMQDLAIKDPDDFGIDLLSPIDGTVVKRYVNSGQYVVTGEPLFEIADFSKMWFMARIYEADLPWVRVGQSVRVTTPAAPNREFDGIITLIDPNFDPATRSTVLRVEVANPLVRTPHGERRLLPHLAYGEGFIELSEEADLVLPRSAVLDTGVRQIAYVDLGEGAFERREVTIGARGDATLGILNGIQSGERVVARGNLLMDAESQMKDPSLATRKVQSSKAEADRMGEPDPQSPGPFDELLGGIAAVAAALSADDLDGYHQAAEALHSQAKPTEPPKRSDARSAMEAVAGLLHLPSAGNLVAAREAYHPLSEAAADLALALRRDGGEGSAVRVFACPMTEDAFPGAPASARWVQTGLPLVNPWYGAEMLSCGAEMQP